MKKKLKQLSAVVMAVAMVLSLSVTAWAGDATDPIPFQPYDHDSVISGDTVSSGDALPDIGDSTEGHSTSEGPEPGDPIEIILPTVTTASGDNVMGVFDMILDPHNMIAKTNGDRYKAEGITKTFDDGGATQSGDTTLSGDEIDYSLFPKLYFATEVSATEEKYSGTSQELTIINKGRQEVNVDLSLDFTCPDTVKLVSSKDDLANAEDGLNDEGAQMYLALLRGEDAVAVTTLSGDEVPMVSVGGKGDYLAETAVTFTWVTDDEDIKAGVGNLSLTLGYTNEREATEDDVAAELATQSGDTINDPEAATVTISGDVIGDWSEYTVSVVSGDVTLPGADETFSGDRQVTVARTVESGDEIIATIDFTVLEPNDRTMKADETQVVKFKAPSDGAVIRTAIEAKTDAYKYAHWDGTTGTKPQGTTAKGYYWHQDDTIPDSDYPYITFKLEGDINNDLEWDQVYTDDRISFVLTWDVLPRSTYNKAVVEEPVNENTGEESEEEGEPEPVEPTGTLPTISYNKTTSSTKTLTITWTKGTGDYARFVPSTTVTSTSGKTLTMTPATTSAGGTLKNTTAYSTLVANDKMIVTFTDPNNVFEAVTVTGTTAAK